MNRHKLPRDDRHRLTATGLAQNGDVWLEGIAPARRPLGINSHCLRQTAHRT